MLRQTRELVGSCLLRVADVGVVVTNAEMELQQDMVPIDEVLEASCRMDPASIAVDSSSCCSEDVVGSC